MSAHYRFKGFTNPQTFSTTNDPAKAFTGQTSWFGFVVRNGIRTPSPEHLLDNYGRSAGNQTEEVGCKMYVPGRYACAGPERRSQHRLFVEFFHFVRSSLSVYMAVTCYLYQSKVLDSIVVSISACHAGDPGSIPGRGAQIFCPRGKFFCV